MLLGWNADSRHEEMASAYAARLAAEKAGTPAAHAWGRYVTNSTKCDSASPHCWGEAYCPVGTSIVSGGCYPTGLDALLSHSTLFPSSNRWSCWSVAQDSATGPYTLYTDAICA